MDSFGIEAFLAIVRHGSLSDAANTLYLSQSTLSHRLAQLEKSIGMTLIDRGRGLRSVSLTADGEEFLKIARKWEELLQETKYIRSQQKKSLIIGAVDSVHNYILPPVYQALIQHSQHLEIRLKTYLGFELYSLLEKGEIDIAFALFEKPMPNMIIQKFYSEPMIVIQQGNHSEPKDSVNLQNLDPDNELYHDWNPTFRIWYELHRKDMKFSGIRVDSAGLIFTLLNFPGKWAIVPISMARKFVALGTFTINNLEDSPPERAYYQARPRYPSAKALEGLQILDSCLSIIQSNA